MPVSLYFRQNRAGHSRPTLPVAVDTWDACSTPPMLASRHYSAALATNGATYATHTANAAWNALPIRGLTKNPRFAAAGTGTFRRQIRSWHWDSTGGNLFQLTFDVNGKLLTAPLANTKTSR